MPGNTSVTIGSHFETFIAGQLEEGRYGSGSEIVRAGLRLLEDHETKVRLRGAALIEGEQSGFVEYSRKEFIDSLD
jgi:antitoxin ParD1/3/4